MRLRLKKHTRPQAYVNLRSWWLHELRQLRARNKIAGISSGIRSIDKQKKVLQRELVKIRRELQ
jgi:hypothetical protein